MDTNKKAIVLINSTSAIGGAQKRYLNLFNHIIKERDDYYFIINKLLYTEFKDNNLLLTAKNVKVIDLGFSKQINSEQGTSEEVIIPSNCTKKKLKKLRKIVWFLRKISTWLSFTKQFRRIQKKEKIKIVYSVWMGGIWVWPLRYFYNFKLIHSYNDSSLSSLSENIFRFFDSEYWVLKHADKIDFLSAGIVPRLDERIGPIESKKITITPNSFILYDKFYPEYPKKDEIVFMCRLTKIKNPMLYLESVKFFNGKYKNKDTIFYIIGIGELASEITKYISENKLFNVRFIGESFQPWYYLRTSKIFVSLQRDENYPSQSVLEAMACENAIIASDVGETRKLITENEGILVKLEAEEIAVAMFKLISNPKLTEKLEKNARKKALEEHNIVKYSEYFFSITK